MDKCINDHKLVRPGSATSLQQPGGTARLAWLGTYHHVSTPNSPLVLLLASLPLLQQAGRVAQTRCPRRLLLQRALRRVLALRGCVQL